MGEAAVGGHQRILNCGVGNRRLPALTNADAA
jgi:hypothetical protein